MTQRDKLIELLNKVQDSGVDIIQSQMDDRITNMYYIENSRIADHLIKNGVIVSPCKVGDVVLCKDCKYNVANRERDELDITDYTDITCAYFMTDGMCPNDFCSRGEMED